jgi:small subunit ribosomal protein S3
MGQKVNSIGLRLRNRRKWDSKWFTDKGYSDLFYRDYITTNYLTQVFEKHDILISRCIIKRSLNRTYIFLYLYLVTTKGSNFLDDANIKVKEVKKTLEKLNKSEVNLSVLNTDNISLDLWLGRKKVTAQLSSFQTRKYFEETLMLVNSATAIKSAPLLARFLARQLETIFQHTQYIDFTKKVLSKFMELRSELLGVRVQWKGRLSGSDRSKKESFQQGQIPLHTIDAKIDYGYSPAFTIYGTCGIKVWFCLK